MKRKQKTKEKILETAFKLFSEKGYLGTTTKEIATLAGITEVTLFRYYSSKEELFMEVLNRYSFIPHLKNTLNNLTSLSLEKVLYQIGKTFIEVLEEKKNLIKLINFEISRYPEKIKKIYENLIQESIEILSNYLNKLKNEGKIKVSNPYLAASAFLGMFFSFFYIKELQGLLQDKNFEKKEIIEEFTEIFINGIKVAEKQN